MTLRGLSSMYHGVSTGLWIRKSGLGFQESVFLCWLPGSRVWEFLIQSYPVFTFNSHNKGIWREADLECWQNTRKGCGSKSVAVSCRSYKARSLIYVYHFLKKRLLISRGLVYMYYFHRQLLNTFHQGFSLPWFIVN